MVMHILHGSDDRVLLYRVGNNRDQKIGVPTGDNLYESHMV